MADIPHVTRLSHDRDCAILMSVRPRTEDDARDLEQHRR